MIYGHRISYYSRGMAWVSSAELAAAVSEAGGLGVIGSGTAHPDWLREQLSRARQLTGKPLGST